MMRHRPMHRWASGAALLLLAALMGCERKPGAVAAAGEDGEWPLPGRDHANTRFSPLTEITPQNAKNLRAVWSFSTGVLAGHEGNPLVVDNMMYVVTPYPNVLYAFDLTQEGYPLKFKYRPFVDPAAVGMACCDVINRGASYVDGKIVYNLLDNTTVAVDAKTGKELWKTTVGNLYTGETTPMAALAVKDKVIIGNAGAEMGVRGWLKGLDLRTGKVLWTGYNTGPDKDVLIDPAFYKPFYPADKGPDIAGSKSWPNERAWKIGGATVWGYVSYDPELDLVYYGTGNPAPWNVKQRPGDNKWATSIVARDPDDGRIRWGYQTTNEDNWDYDAISEIILADLQIQGQTRKVGVQFNKNGFAYTIDRATGEVLVAEPYVEVNWARKVDLKTGRPDVDPTKKTGAGIEAKNICPTLEGGKNFNPAAYSPQTGLFYVPTNNMCMDFNAAEVNYIVGTPFIGAGAPYYPGKGGNLGAFIAWDAVNAKRVWEVKEKYPVWSGALVTAGGVAFYGTLDGWFKAVDMRDGKALWKFKVGSGVVGNPISYLGPDGKQYVAIMAGIGGDWYLLSADARADDPTDTRTPSDIAPDLARHTSFGGLVFVFAL